MSYRARLATYFCATLSIALLVLGSQACLEAYRLNQPYEMRRLEEPGAQFLQQVCADSHLEVVQLSPLRLAGTVSCPDDFRLQLQLQLQELYQIRPDQGEELVLIQGLVPFHWADHPEQAATVLAAGALLFSGVAWIGLQHFLCRWRSRRQTQFVVCPHQRGRQKSWLSLLASALFRLAVFGSLAAVASGIASPLLLLAVMGLLTAWATGKLVMKGLGKLGKSLNRRAGKPRPASTRPIQNALQEAAIILMSFPPEFSAQLFKQLGADDVHRVTLEISQLPPVSPDTRKEILETFYSHLDKVCQGQCAGRHGGACDPVAMSRILLDLYLKMPTQEKFEPVRQRRKIYSCPVCDNVFLDEEGLLRHGAMNHPTWKIRLQKLMRRSLRWLAIAMAASGLGVGTGLAWAYASPCDRQEVLHQQIARYIADPVIVAIVERQGEGSALVGLGRTALNSPELRQVVQNCGLQVGLEPEKVACIEVNRPRNPQNLLTGLGLMVPCLLFLAWLRNRLKRHQPSAPASAPQSPTQDSSQPTRSSATSASPIPQSTSFPVDFELTRESLRPNPIAVEVGRKLVPLVDPRQKAHLAERIPAIRKHLALELGVILPGVRIRDNLRLPPYTYSIKVQDREIARGEVQPHHYLAIGPEKNLGGLTETLTQDPTFGQPAAWIKPEQRGDAERLGCAIFDSVSVFAMHFTEITRQHAWELLSYYETCFLLQQSHLKPVLEALKNREVDKVLIWEVLRLLLQERVCIANLETILESILLVCSHTRKAEDLCEHARLALRESTFQSLCLDESGDPRGKLLAFRVSQEQETVLRQPLEPEAAAPILEQLRATVEKLRDFSRRAVLVTSPDCRVALRRLLDSMPHTVVLSLAEIPPEANIEWLD